MGINFARCKYEREKTQLSKEYSLLIMAILAKKCVYMGEKVHFL